MATMIVNGIRVVGSGSPFEWDEEEMGPYRELTKSEILHNLVKCRHYNVVPALIRFYQAKLLKIRYHLTDLEMINMTHQYFI